MLQELNKVGNLEGCALGANAYISLLPSKQEGMWGARGDALHARCSDAALA